MSIKPVFNIDIQMNIKVKCAITGKTVVVPVHGGRDMKKGTLLRILKQAGIDKSAIDWYYFS